MSDGRKPWFVSYRGWRTPMPVRWQGWAALTIFFAVCVFVTREFDGMARAIALATIALVFTVLSLARTGSISGTNAPKNPWYWLFGGGER